MTENTLMDLPPSSTDGETFTDALTQVGAQRLLIQAVEEELAVFLAAHAGERLADGRARVVRHGYLPEREVQTGIGPVSVRCPRVRDRAEDVAADNKLRFLSSVLPKYLRRSTSVDELIPALYLSGISTNDVQRALSALLGPEAPNLSRHVVRKLTEGWRAEMAAFGARDLTGQSYVYIWADGVYLKARKERDSQCILVILGATPDGRKELVGFRTGYREDKQGWKELLLSLKARGLTLAPKLATGDGALGFWAALREVYGDTRQQRCWVHKTVNVLGKFPKSMQSKVKADLREIWNAETRAKAETAFDLFIEKYDAKYPKATECLRKDRAELLNFYDFPAEHWAHIRTTNPIESVFATVRHRTKRAKNCLSHKTALPMVFKLIKAAETRWQRLRGRNHLPKLMEGVTFTDGSENSLPIKNAA